MKGLDAYLTSEPPEHYCIVCGEEIDVPGRCQGCQDIYENEIDETREEERLWR
jgi:predicted nucleic acid-binding Zn ribbon protein